MSNLYKECVEFLESENWNVKRECETGLGNSKVYQEFWTDKEGKCVCFFKVDDGKWYITMYTNWSRKVKNAGEYYGRVKRIENLMYFVYLPIENIKQGE